MRRVVKLLIVADIVIVLALGIYIVARSDTGGRLQGSHPPQGQRMEDLSRLAGITPAFPAPHELRGSPVAVIGTCLECRSGDIIGGFLSRIGNDIPQGSRVVVLGWDGSIEQFRKQYPMGDRIDLYQANAAAGAAARKQLHIGESGIAYLYDSKGVWRTTWHLGQLDRTGFLDDLASLSE